MNGIPYVLYVLSAGIIASVATVLVLGALATLGFLFIWLLLEIACWVLPPVWTGLIYIRYRVAFIRRFADAAERLYARNDSCRDRFYGWLTKVRKGAKVYGTRRKS